MRSTVVMATIVALSGCGLTMTKGPDPQQPATERPRCTETFQASKRDGVGAVLGLLSIVFGGLALEAGSESALAPALVVGGLAVMVGAYASGGVGYYRVKKCKKAIGEFERRTMQPQPYPPPQGYPPPQDYPQPQGYPQPQPMPAPPPS